MSEQRRQKDLAAWGNMAANIAARRQHLTRLTERRLGSRLALLHRALVVCEEASRAAFEATKDLDGQAAEAQKARAVLSAWILGRLLDAYRELGAGNLAGGAIHLRSTTEGCVVLASVLSDDPKAVQWALGKLIGQSEARQLIDPSDPKYKGQVELPKESRDGILKNLYVRESNLAHPTIFAANLQSEVDGDELTAVGKPVHRFIKPEGVDRPRTQNALLRQLFYRALGLVQLITGMPLSEERKRGIVERRVELQSLGEEWPED